MTWRTLKPAKDLDYRCDVCGKPATTLHFLPWIRGAERVVFACKLHDADGYWVELDRWFDPDQGFPEHVAGKAGGDEALALLAARIEALRQL